MGHSFFSKEPAVLFFQLARQTAHSLSLLLSKQMQHTLSLTATTECLSCLKSTEFVVTLSKRRESAAFAWREEGRVSELFALPAERTELQVPY